jgi:dihydrofolate synthase/folylpolyglutamate synthase
VTACRSAQQAVRQGLATVELPGRFQVLAGRPAVVLDVAHNPHAAAHLASNLDNMGFFPVTWGCLRCDARQGLEGIVRHLDKRIDHWLLVDLPGARAARAEELRERLDAAGIRAIGERLVETHATPGVALRSALERADANDRIVVFGSFLTVADVLVSRRSSGSVRAQP